MKSPDRTCVKTPENTTNLNGCWSNAGPASQTLDQHRANIGSCLVFSGLAMLQAGYMCDELIKQTDASVVVRFCSHCLLVHL